MISTLKEIFGIKPKEDLATLIKEGAIILDVRSKSEYSSGHIKGSLNISVDQLKANLTKIDKNKTIITCCASGMRSSSAKSTLKNNGYEKVINGGSWYNVAKYC